MTIDAGLKPEGAPERSPVAGAGAPSGVDAGPKLTRNSSNSSPQWSVWDRKGNVSSLQPIVRNSEYRSPASACLNAVPSDVSWLSQNAQCPSTETNRKGGGDSIRVESANLGVARDTTTDAPHVCQANLACR
jgi:hypothetical protein